MAFHLRWLDLAALFIILGSGFLVYSPHVLHPGPYMDPGAGKLIHHSLGYYPYPLHIDGWQHLAQARQILEEGFTDRNPQFQEYVYHSSRERGFHVILAAITLLPGISLMGMSSFLPAVFFMMTALLVYLYFRDVLRKPEGGLFSIVLLAFMPSNANILGNWFLIPLNLWLFLFMGHLLIFHRVRDVRWRWGGIILVLIASYLIYPFATLFILLHLGIHGLRLLWERRQDLSQPVRVSLFVGPVVLALLALSQKHALSQLLFRQGWTAVEYHYLLPDLLHPVFIFFGLLGLWLLYRKDTLFSLLGWTFSLFAIVSTYTYLSQRFTLLVPYQRLLFFWQAILILGAGYGLAWSIQRLQGWSFLSGIFGRMRSQLVTSVLAIIVLLVIFLSLFPGYYIAKPDRFSVQKAMGADEKILLSEAQQQGRVMLADPFLSATIYPMTGMKAAATISANLDGRDQALYGKFMRADCSGRSSLLRKYDVDHVLSRRSISCPGMVLVDRAGGSRLYEVR
ncbi:MAG: hypothetical protein GXP63_06685 [DPANN group archaeon]|nr:hypothetical protein [DPANN group archaeon]